MNRWFALPDSALFLRARVVLVALTLTLAGCGQPSSDAVPAAEDSAGENVPKAAGVESTGFVSDASIKAAQQTVLTLEQQKLLQSAQASGTVVERPQQTQAQRDAMLKEAAAKTDEVLRQTADDAADSTQQP